MFSSCPASYAKESRSPAGRAGHYGGLAGRSTGAGPADPDWGYITPLSGGTATLAATGGLTVSGVVAAGGTPHPANFTGAAQGRSLIFIQPPTTAVTLTRAGGGATVSVSAFTVEGGNLKLALASGAFTFRIGGTLTVAAAQADGIYSGTLDVTAYYC